MRFVFDENHPPVLARMIAPLAQTETYLVQSVADLGLRGRPDTEVLASICMDGGRGILITADRAMRTRKHEAAAVRSTGAVVVVGVKAWNQQADLWERARMMLWWWPTIVDASRKAEPGTFLELPWRQRTEALRRWVA